MDKLAGYGSDDDCEDSPRQKKGESVTSHDYYKHNQHKQPSSRQVDVNYEEVQMDLSEDSNSDSSRDTPVGRYDRTSSKSSRSSDRKDNGRDDDRYSRDDDRYSRDDDRYSRDSPKYYKSRKDDEEDRYRRRDDRRDDRDRHGNRNRDNRDDKYNRDKYRDDRSKNYRPRRSSSRERRSRSPRKPDFRTKRSSSRDREPKPVYQRRFDRAPVKSEQEKIEMPRSVEQPHMKPEPDSRDNNKDRFYMPGITGRFKDQIERRKLLWQKKELPQRRERTSTSTTTTTTTTTAPGGTTAGKVWQTTTFAQDTDGKVASKFKRLMGIKESTEGPKGTTDVLKKQEEMFSSMEQQYEVARTATHTMRGVGLGFGSFQR